MEILFDENGKSYLVSEMKPLKDEKVLSLTPSQRYALEIIRCGFSLAKDCGLKIYNFPEIGTFPLNGNKFNDKVYCIGDEDENKINFIFTKKCGLNVDIPGITDESVLCQWYGCEEEGWGIHVNE